MNTTSTKTVDLSTAVNGLKIQSFTDVDFTPATGNATLQGPLSLQLELNNQSDFPLYIGVKVYTLDGAFNIADRKQIAFLPSKTQLVISGASVPQLAYIGGIVTKIDVYFYVLAAQAGHGGATTLPTIALRMLPPAIISAPQPVIGQDTQVYQPGNLFIASSLVNVAAGNTNIVLASTGTIPVYSRMRIHSYELWVQEATIGNLVAKLQLIDPNANVLDVARWDSFATVRNAVIVTPAKFIVPSSWLMRVVADNFAAGALFAYGSILGEYIL